MGGPEGPGVVPPLREGSVGSAERVVIPAVFHERNSNRNRAVTNNNALLSGPRGGAPGHSPSVLRPFPRRFNFFTIDDQG